MQALPEFGRGFGRLLLHLQQHAPDGGLESRNLRVQGLGLLPLVEGWVDDALGEVEGAEEEMGGGVRRVGGEGGAEDGDVFGVVGEDVEQGQAGGEHIVLRRGLTQFLATEAAIVGEQRVVPGQGRVGFGVLRRDGGIAAGEQVQRVRVEPQPVVLVDEVEDAGGVGCELAIDVRQRSAGLGMDGQLYHLVAQEEASGEA